MVVNDAGISSLIMRIMQRSLAELPSRSARGWAATYTNFPVSLASSRLRRLPFAVSPVPDTRTGDEATPCEADPGLILMTRGNWKGDRKMTKKRKEKRMRAVVT